MIKGMPLLQSGGILRYKCTIVKTLIKLRLKCSMAVVLD